MASDAEHLFICPWVSVCPSWRSVCSSPLPIVLIGLFVFLKRSHGSSLSILEINPLSKVSLPNIFSYTFGSLFILLLLSLAVQSFLFWWSLICLFVFLRESRREGEKEGKKHQCMVAPHMALRGHLAFNPGMCPDWKCNRQLVHSPRSIYWAAAARCLFFLLCPLL